MIDGARTGNVGIMERGYIEGLSPNLRSRDGDPVIVIGAEAGHANVVQYLIYRKARLDERGASEHTPLTAAAARNYVEIMNMLLEGGADIDKTGARKEVPIIIAAREGHYEAVKLLIEKGAYLEDTDLTGRTALDWARETRNRDLVRLLEDAQ
ncbi:MAG: ankyrin repeat domain-containing protein [Parvibaculales bacterium]